ncbi:chromosomal replication initiator protein DnaA, partial [Aeromonas hydrophila]
VRDKYLIRVNGIINELCGVDGPALRFDIGNRPHPVTVAASRAPAQGAAPVNNLQKSWESKPETNPEPNHKSNTNVNYTFE